MQNKLRKKGGFTLMEMLIVVAIIAVLVAIAIATYSGSLTKAKIATCQANRRNLVAKLSMEYMLESGDRFSDGDEIALTEDEIKTYSCPSGGKYTAVLKDGYISVSCDVSGHEGGGTEIAENNRMDGFVTSVFDKYTSLVTNDKMPSNQQINSDYIGADGSYTEKLVSDLNIDSLGATVWQIQGTKLTWTTGSNTNKAGGAAIIAPAIQYDSATKTYTVGKVSLKPSEGNAVNLVGRISTDIVSSGTYNTYSEALAEYNKLLG